MRSTTSKPSSRPMTMNFSRIFALSKTPVNLKRITNDRKVTDIEVSLEEVMEELNTENRKQQRLGDRKVQKNVLNMRDLYRLFVPNMTQNEGTHSINTSPFDSREFGFSAIMPRPKARCYLVDLGLLNILCCRDRVDILYEGSNRKNMVNWFVDDLINSLIRDQNDSSKNMPFALHVLETALSCVVSKFSNRIALVEPVFNEVIDDAISDPTQIKVGRMAAMKKSLFAYNQGVGAIIQAINELLDNDRDMADMNLEETPRDASDHEEVEFLLEAYLADIQECLNKGKGMIEQIEDSMDVIEIHLNMQRNKIINLSLLMEMMGVTAGIGAVIGGIMGMNLKNNLEEHPSAFGWVTSITVFIMMFLLTCLIFRWQRYINTKPTSSKYQHSAFKQFFSFIDDIETKIQESESMDRHLFEKTVKSIIGNNVCQEELDMLFKVHDDDNDGKITKKELPKQIKSMDSSIPKNNFELELTVPESASYLP